MVPPESPQYVDIPDSYQSFQPYVPRAKGTLPVPREVFRAKRQDQSLSSYIEDVTSDPAPHNVKPADQLSDIGRYRRRAAEVRKEQLREGLKELHTRKMTGITAMGINSSRKQQQRAVLLAQAEREDARLTQSSIPKHLRPEHQHSIEALQAEVAAARAQHERKLANVEKHAKAKQAERMDDLHTLYMNARHFITDQASMDRLIAQQFDSNRDSPDPAKRMIPTHADFRTDVSSGTSMWNFGPPDGIKNMIADATNRPRDGDAARALTGRGGALSAVLGSRRQNDLGADARFRKEQERMKRLAEKLSGGKI